MVQCVVIDCHWIGNFVGGIASFALPALDFTAVFVHCWMFFVIYFPRFSAGVLSLS